MHLLVLLEGALIALTGTAAGSSSASCSLSLRHALTGTANASSSAAASLELRLALTGSAHGGSAAAGSLSGFTALYKPPAPTGWKSTAARTGPDSAFALGTRSAGEG